MELLPHDVIEHNILERLDVKTLHKFKSVSKQWKSSIESRYFQERQLIQHRRQTRDPYVLLVSATDRSTSPVPMPRYEDLRTLVLDSSSLVTSLQIPIIWEDNVRQVCSTSIDGLICLHHPCYVARPSIVVNPTTQWYRTFPPCNYQLVTAAANCSLHVRDPQPCLGFGKDKICGTYKAVWLYNTAKLGLNNNDVTSCEVFDFDTNAWSWRHVVPASRYSIIYRQGPVYADGSLHWFTNFIMVLSFDLHTETFHLVSKPPFLPPFKEGKIGMCNLDDRLCVYEQNWPNQVIWSLDSSDHKTWKKIYSIDIHITNSMFPSFYLTPLAIVDKDKLLFYDSLFGESLVTHDPKTKTYELSHTFTASDFAISYFPSLFSIL